MMIYIPSARRAETIHTTKYLDDGGVKDYKVLLHTEQDKDEYLKAGRVKESNIIVTNQPRGVTHQRRFIVNELVKKNDWFITMDDNIRGFTGVEPKFYDEKILPTQKDPGLRKSYEHNYDAKTLLHLFQKDLERATVVGANYVGFATVPNFYFRSKKYRYVGYIISKAAIIKNTGVEYDPNLEAMEDFGFCAEQLLTYGRVVINNFLKPTAGHYEKGGIGTYEERLPRKIKDCEYLMKKYPGLFRYKEKQGCHPKAELQFRFVSIKQLELWRRRISGGVI